MKALQNYWFLVLFFGLILITDCNRTESPTASEETPSDVVILSLQKSNTDCIPAPSGLVSWWPGDGDANDIVDDNNGALQGGASFEAGLVDQAFSFDGEGDYVIVPHSPNLNFGANDFTVDLWVNFNTTVGEQILIEKWVQIVDNPPWSTGWTLTKLVDNVIRLALSDGSGPEVRLDRAPPSIQSNTWYHVAITRNNNTFTLYWNGVALGSIDNPLNLDSNSSLKIGHRGTIYDTPGSDETREFDLNGLIDEVEVYNRALTASDIQAIFNAGSAGKCKFISVNIDIKPGSDPNSINSKSKGVIPVAVLTDQDFDATTVDVSTVSFGPDGAEPVHNGHIEDVDGDGDDDLVLHFKTQDTGIQCGDTEAILTGETFDGQAIEGSDSINTVGCK